MSGRTLKRGDRAKLERIRSSIVGIDINESYFHISVGTCMSTAEKATTCNAIG